MLLVVEINLNNDLLVYVENDIQLNVLAPNSMILGGDMNTVNSNADEGESKNRGHWKISNESQLYTGKNQVVRALQMEIGTNFLVQPMKLLYL